jgi:hypothetical protein
MRSHLRPAGARGWRVCLTVVSTLAVLWPCRAALGWGHEGHAVVALIAEHYMTELPYPAALRLPARISPKNGVPCCWTHSAA